MLVAGHERKEIKGRYKRSSFASIPQPRIIKEEICIWRRILSRKPDTIKDQKKKLVRSAEQPLQAINIRRGWKV